MAMRLLCVRDDGVRMLIKRGEIYTLRGVWRCPHCEMSGYLLQEVFGAIELSRCIGCDKISVSEDSFLKNRFIPLGDDNIKLADEDTEERELVLVDRKEHLA